MIIKKIYISLYILLGVAFLIFGFISLKEHAYICVPARVDISDGLYRYLVGITQGILHLIMELGSTYMLIGSTLIWSAYNYKRTYFTDTVLSIFFLISSVVHWKESYDHSRLVNTPLISFIPFVFMIAILLLKRKQEVIEKNMS